MRHEVAAPMTVPVPTTSHRNASPAPQAATAARLARGVTVLALAALALGSVGCKAHSPVILKPTTDFYAERGASKYPPHNNKVFITQQELPADSVEVLGRIEHGRVWYGSWKNIRGPMADEGRKMGADAVMNVRAWKQPSGWSWASPHGTGVAVKIKDPDRLDLSKFDGESF